MLAKTQGIVLKTINYSETSVVAKIYTEQFGLKSYLIQGVRKRNAKTKANSLSLLSLLDMEVYNRESKEMQYIKEIKRAHIFQSLPYDIRKSSIAIFLNELIYNSIREEEANPALFNYLFNSIHMLDLLKDNFSSFHLHFAVQLSKYLGFGPADASFKSDALFDLADGKFHSDKRLGIYKLNQEESLCFYRASALSFDTFNQLPFSKQKRKIMLEHILSYYQLHSPEFKLLRSHEVLEAVLA
ncbi:MAG: DNA repair protein RecO [Bacteroidales bacterium]|jgi:DNA repair protein RecO (recombination protein O)|nr:DNA repair protein RecO [Bacteroidales bacterium]